MNPYGHLSKLTPWHAELPADRLPACVADEHVLDAQVEQALADHPRGDIRLAGVVARRLEREAVIRPEAISDQSVVTRLVDEVVRTAAIATGSAQPSDRAWLWVRLDQRVRTTLGDRQGVATLLSPDERHDFASDFVVHEMERLEDPAEDRLGDYEVGRLPIEVWLAPRRIVRLRALDYAKARRAGGREVSLTATTFNRLVAEEDEAPTPPDAETVMSTIEAAIKSEPCAHGPSAAWVLLGLQLWQTLDRHDTSVARLLDAAVSRVASANNVDRPRAVELIESAHGNCRDKLELALNELADERDARFGTSAAQRLRYVSDRQSAVRYELAWCPLDTDSIVSLLGVSIANAHQQAKRMRDILAEALRELVHDRRETS